MPYASTDTVYSSHKLFLCISLLCRIYVDHAVTGIGAAVNALYHLLGNAIRLLDGSPARHFDMHSGMYCLRAYILRNETMHAQDARDGSRRLFYLCLKLWPRGTSQQ